MIDFTKAIEARQRQDSVWVDGTEYKIHTEFYWWVLFGRMIIKSRPVIEYDIFYIWNPPENKTMGFEELKKFYINEQPLPHPSKKENDILSVEWKIDSEYIRAAFLQQYGIDLLTQDLHWHCFTALFKALKDTAMNDIISARLYDGKNKDMISSRESWQIANPQTRKRTK